MISLTKRVAILLAVSHHNGNMGQDEGWGWMYPMLVEGCHTIDLFEALYRSVFALQYHIVALSFHYITGGHLEDPIFLQQL